MKDAPDRTHFNSKTTPNGPIALELEKGNEPVVQQTHSGTARLFAQPAAATTATPILTAMQAQQKTSPVSTRLCEICEGA